MDYIEAWEKLNEKKDKQQAVMLHSFKNPYGFRININHPMVCLLYTSDAADD